MDIKIALAGNPNSGKTTLFNDLTGSNQYVGNWPGVTVEKKEGRLKGHSLMKRRMLFIRGRSFLMPGKRLKSRNRNSQTGSMSANPIFHG